MIDLHKDKTNVVYYGFSKDGPIKRVFAERIEDSSMRSLRKFYRDTVTCFSFFGTLNQVHAAIINWLSNYKVEDDNQNKVGGNVISKLCELANNNVLSDTIMNFFIILEVEDESKPDFTNTKNTDTNLYEIRKNSNRKTKKRVYGNSK